MLIIGLLWLILISSNNTFSIKEYKNIIHISILIMLYMIIILNNGLSLELINNGILIFNNTFLITSYNMIIKNIIIILGIIYMIILYNYVEYYNKSIYIKEFIILIIFNILGICLFIDSINSLIIFITIELQSYSIYLITSTYYKNELSVGIYSSKNGLIYFLLGSLASIIILFGLTLLYNDTGLINMIDINSYLLSLNKETTSIDTSIIGLLLVLVGLFFKIGLAPIHNWLVNIYVNIPTIVTLWISLIPKISLFTFILTLNYIFNDIFDSYNLNIFFQIFILSSMIFGAFGGLPQFSLKRILVYSGLANNGYILLSIWTHNQYSIFSYLFFIIQYAITHFVLFMIVIFIIMYYNNWLVFKRNITSNNNNYNFTNNLYINDIISLLYYNKSLTIIFLITLSSLIGIPPLLGFYGKYYILIAGLLNGYWFTAIILILVSMITSYYYGFIMKSLIMNNESNNNVMYKLSNSMNISYVYSYILSLLGLIILFPLLYLDIYQNGIVIINYFNNI